MKKLVITVTAIMLSGCSALREQAATHLSDVDVCYNMGRMIKKNDLDTAQILQKEAASRKLDVDFCVYYAKEGLK